MYIRRRWMQRRQTVLNKQESNGHSILMSLNNKKQWHYKIRANWNATCMHNDRFQSTYISTTLTHKMLSMIMLLAQLRRAEMTSYLSSVFRFQYASFIILGLTSIFHASTGWMGCPLSLNTQLLYRCPIAVDTNTK